MRLPRLILPLLAALATALAQPAAPAENPAPPAGPREAALARLLAERESPAALARAIASARASGVSEQAVLEARFLFHIDRRDDAALVALLPELLRQRDVFKIEDSAIFAAKEDWLAIIEYVQALAALDHGAKDDFKHHITEAFWLSPRQAAAFAPHIERLRLADAMRAVTLDFSVQLAPLAAGEPVTLASLVAGKKALLLHFWSPRSRECEASLPDFRATAAALVSNNIAVASLLPDDSPPLLAEARALLQPGGGPPPGAWLIDPKLKPLARELRIQNLPTMVLVSSSGTILFNGDPTDDPFWETLRRLDASIQRPKAAPPPAP
ncbi:MAG: hypothetical protein WCJ14_14810 [Verrucomicrobiota bacterium]